MHCLCTQRTSVAPPIPAGLAVILLLRQADTSHRGSIQAFTQLSNVRTTDALGLPGHRGCGEVGKKYEGDQRASSGRGCGQKWGLLDHCTTMEEERRPQL